VINLGSTAIANTAILAATGLYTADTVTSVGASTVAYEYTAAGSTNSAVVQSISGFENVIGTSGKDYIVASSSGTSITAGLGADYIKLGAGADTVNYADKTEGSDTISGFAYGSDVLSFVDGTTLAIDGTATKLFTKGTAAAVKTAIAGGGTAVKYNVIVITDAVTNTAAGIDAALTTAFDYANTSATTTGVIVIAAASTGDAKVWFDAAGSATNATAGAATYELATLTGIALADLANLTTANFTIS